MIPAILVVGIVVLCCLPFARKKPPKLPRAEKDQTDAPQEEFIQDHASSRSGDAGP